MSDGYVLQLLDDRGSLVTNSSQPSGHTRFMFDSLTPGKKYRVQVQTTSGGVHSPGVSAGARTRKTSLACFSMMSFRAAEQQSEYFKREKVKNVHRINVVIFQKSSLSQVFFLSRKEVSFILTKKSVFQNKNFCRSCNISSKKT